MSQASSSACGCCCGCSVQIVGEHYGTLCASCTARAGTALVSLAESPSTGYRWRLSDLPDGVQQIADTYLVADPDRKRIGGTGRHLFALTGPAGGTQQISFCLGRPWLREPDEWLVLDVLFEEHVDRRRSAA